MSITLTFLLLLVQFLNGTSVTGPCAPNTQFHIGNRTCFCDKMGRWSENNCKAIDAWQTCVHGKVIRKDCNQCICQYGRLVCTQNNCSMHLHHGDFKELWCTPFKSYYINCSICVCPANGKISEAQCAVDKSCPFNKNVSLTQLMSSIKGKVCLPKVMYYFECFLCLCSEEGIFLADNCIKSCKKQEDSNFKRKCIPGYIYRMDCNVCLCPDDGAPNVTFCTKSICNNKIEYRSLRTIKSIPRKCTLNRFTDPICMYCKCNSNGIVDDNSCLELECLKYNAIEYDIKRETCSPGEMIPVCMECFCSAHGITTEIYCSKTCSYHSKINVLEKIIIDNKYGQVVQKSDFRERAEDEETCDPKSIYVERNRYCICPPNGKTRFKLCTSNEIVNLNFTSKAEYVLKVDFNTTCTPKTLVEFDCNICYCTKNGTIDPKWCTYDNCGLLRDTDESRANMNSIGLEETFTDTCQYGSISMKGCNFCICPESGLMRNRVCTKNECPEHFDKQTFGNKFTCGLLSYYQVDCNICRCPESGLKNLAMCTKNWCKLNFLRSDICMPGELFSDECNICICPLNGEKKEKVCTNYTCVPTVATRKIYHAREGISEPQLEEKVTKKIDICFPGEEFLEGCQLCVCPEIGLKSYASCTQLSCEDNKNSINKESTGNINNETRRHEEDCYTINNTVATEKIKCTPGAMYIIRCHQCICPYMGSIRHFCRPLPKGTYCEQAFPGVDFLPMSRKQQDQKALDNSTDASNAKMVIQVPTNHNHTRYRCEKPGQITDECFICECDDNNVLVIEHCFKSVTLGCVKAIPTFLDPHSLLHELK